MRGKVRACVIFCAFLALTLWGCGQKSDHSALFRGAYVAEVEGTLNGTHFAATIEAEAMTAGVPRAVTVTFYAPSGLKGTILRRGADGGVTLTCGSVTVRNPADARSGEGLSRLLDLFPTAGEVRRVTLNEAGQTVVEEGDCTVIFLPDGTPFSLTAEDVEVRVIRFEGQGG